MPTKQGIMHVRKYKLRFWDLHTYSLWFGTLNYGLCTASVLKSFTLFRWAIYTQF